MSVHKQSRLIEHFVAGSTARAAAAIVGVSDQHGHKVFHASASTDSRELPGYQLYGEVKADESYFGGVRKGKRGRRAASSCIRLN